MEDNFEIIDMPEDVKNDIIVGNITCSYNYVSVTSKRKMGTSTRIIDNIIQLLFDGKTVVVKDYPDSKKLKDAEFLAKRVIKRLKIEHRLTAKDIKKERLIDRWLTLSLRTDKINDDAR